MQRVTRVEVLDGYRIRISFADGLSGEVDLSDMVGRGVFEGLRDPSEFARAFVDPITHTVAWPGGIDLCPDTLHQDVLSAERAA